MNLFQHILLYTFIISFFVKRHNTEYLTLDFYNNNSKNSLHQDTEKATLQSCYKILYNFTPHR